MVTGEGASAYAAGSQVWKGASGTLTAKPASTPMASQIITGPRWAVTLSLSSPLAAIVASAVKSMLPVERNTARKESSSATLPAIV